MAQRYRLTPIRRLANWAIRPLIRLGVAGAHTYLLTVRGRRTGREFSTPVRLVEDGARWLVAPYGEVGWVRNARAVREVVLTRAGHSETVKIEEVHAAEAAPVLRRYLEKVAIVRPYFDVTPDAPLEAFEAEAPRHPVFRIRPAGT